MESRYIPKTDLQRRLWTFVFTRLRGMGLHLYRTGVTPIKEHQISPNSDIQMQLLQPHDIARYSLDTSMQVSTEFAQAAQNRGDQCITLTRGTEIVAYCWITQHRAPATEDVDVIITEANRIYGYKAATNPHMRGQGLMPTLIQHLENYLFAQGISARLGWVAPENYSAIRNFVKSGTTFKGWFGYWAGAKPITFRSRGARISGLRLVPATAEYPSTD